jgi:uncharacterized OB-fold protein
MPQPVQYRGMALIVPDNDSEWKEFYEHARAHRLVVRKCKACGLMRYPPTHACPGAWSSGGRGTRYLDAGRSIRTRSSPTRSSPASRR